MQKYTEMDVSSFEMFDEWMWMQEISIGVYNNEKGLFWRI